MGLCLILGAVAGRADVALDFNGSRAVPGNKQVDRQSLSGIQVSSDPGRILVLGVSIFSNNASQDGASINAEDCANDFGEQVLSASFTPDGGATVPLIFLGCASDPNDSKLRAEVWYLASPETTTNGTVEVIFHDPADSGNNFLDKGAAIGVVTYSGGDAADPFSNVGFDETGDGTVAQVTVEDVPACSVGFAFVTAEKDANPILAPSPAVQLWSEITEEGDDDTADDYKKEVDSVAAGEPNEGSDPVDQTFTWNLETQKKFLTAGLYLNCDESLGTRLDFGDAPATYGDASHDQAGLLETVIVSNVDETFQTVNLRSRYENPVAVCTYNLPSSSDAEAVVRLQNVSADSFEVRIQQPQVAMNSNSPTAGDVYCLVAEEGEHTLPDGRTFEARTVESDGLNGANIAAAWAQTEMETVTGDITGTYTNAAVLGQVMTSADADFSVFWSSDCTVRQNPPSAAPSPGSAEVCVGKHVAEADLGTTRDTETLGYIVVESGTGTVNGVDYEAALSSNNINGVGNGGGSTYNLVNAGIDYNSGAATMSAINGGNGGWAVLFGADPLPTGQIVLSIDEDTIEDTERNHTNEQVAYWVFSDAAAIVLEEPYLGTLPGDLEDSAQSGADADGDDILDTSYRGVGNDEEGVTFSASGNTIFAQVTVTNPTGGNATLCGWLDVPDAVTGADGVFDDTDGQCTTVGTGTTVTNLQWTVPNQNQIYTSYARFRVTTDPAGMDETNAADPYENGEAEDYLLVFNPTVVSIGEVSLEAVAVDEFLQGIGAEEMSRGALAEVLARWSPETDTAGASREQLLNAVRIYLDPDGDSQLGLLRWNTLEEQGTAGFYVERRAEGNNSWVRVNEKMLPGLHTAPLGGEYMLADPGAEPNRVYYYRLIEQEARGSTRSYGPYKVEM